MLTDSIKARFNGADYAMKIHREDVPIFEVQHEATAFDLYHRIAGGMWSVKDIANVIRFATSKRPDRRNIAFDPAFILKYRQGDFLKALGARGPDLVDKAFATKPIAQYAALAQLVLGAALFGIDEADATFTDEQTDGEE
jgi:hypothetical protein